MDLLGLSIIDREDFVGNPLLVRVENHDERQHPVNCIVDEIDV